MQTVYLDVLIGVNVYINYLLLVLTARFAGCRQVRTRIVLGSIIGALSSCTILIDIPSVLLSAAIKVLTAVLMILAAFKINSHRKLIKLILILTLITFAFAGTMIGIKSVMSTNAIAVSNFSVYLDISPVTLIFATLVCYLILSIYSKITARKTEQKVVCRITISNQGETVTLDGLLDTGNTLTEPFSGLPVVVVSEKSIYRLVPEEIKSFDVSHPCSSRQIRLIPYASVGGKGLLKGFMPESITVESEGRESRTQDVYIGVTNGETEVPALINPDIFI